MGTRKRVIVGAGFAGIATAYHLARRGLRDLLVLEREVGPGHHASGRNAGLLRQSTHDRALVELLRTGARAARRLVRSIAGALRPCGSLSMGRKTGQLCAGSHAQFVDAADYVPGLIGQALFDPEDAIVDPNTLLLHLEAAARALGVEFSYLDDLQQIHVARGRVDAVKTRRRIIPTRSVVIAAGAWAGEVAALAGSCAIQIEPRRRHIFHGHLEACDASAWPFVWNDDRGVYFRPEGSGLLLSPCDVDPHPAGAARFDPTKRELLAEKLTQAFDTLGTWRLGPGWACLRSFTPDERFVIGHDPEVQGLFWVAGLGGHGVTAAWAVGRLAAQVYLGQREAGPFDPARFAG